MKAERLNWGPKLLRKWTEQIAKVINSNRVVPGVGTSVTESPGGTAVNVGTKGDGGGSSSATETVTGAVNGAPSTLNVQTDGGGWVAIP